MLVVIYGVWLSAAFCVCVTAAHARFAVRRRRPGGKMAVHSGPPTQMVSSGEITHTVIIKEDTWRTGAEAKTAGKNINQALSDALSQPNKDPN